jgi:heme oxygenase (biliverdin-IX-beta and delta-forming)
MTQDPTRAAREPVHAQQTPKVPATRKVKPPLGAVHRLLRTATREDHASIDRMLLRFDLNRLEDYRIFLTIHLAALSALQVEWRPEDGADFSSMLDCLRADLKALGWTAATPPAAGNMPVSVPRGLGIAYVVRGSRLGGAVLRRDIVGELPTSYLDFVPTLGWTRFLAELESIADIPNAKQEAARAARNTFSVFAAEYSRLQGAIPTPKKPESKVFSSRIRMPSDHEG